MYLTYSAFNAPMGGNNKSWIRTVLNEDHLYQIFLNQVSNREFVALREHFVLEGGADLIVTQSINYQRQDLSRANHVVSEFHISHYLKE
jgi:hypothetical protein